MFHRKTTITFFLLLFFSNAALALSQDELQQVRKQFQQGRTSGKINQKVHIRLHGFLQQEPDNPLLLVYYGSTETLMGKYAWMPWNKLGYVKNGIGHIERALRLARQQKTRGKSAAPSPLEEVQLVAASTYVVLPDRFNTLESGRRLLTRLLALDARSKWPDRFRYSLYDAAAKAAERDGNEVERAQWRARADAVADSNSTGVN